VPAVDGDLRAVQVGRAGGQQEHHHVGDLLGLPEPAGQRLLDAGLDEHRARVVQDRRVDGPRVHDVDPDAARRELERRGLGEAAQPPLGDRVGEREVRGQPGDRADVDDRCAVVVRHQRREGPHAEHGAGQVDADDPVPVLQVHVVQVRAVGDARVVDQAVQHAAVRGDLGRQFRPLRLARHVKVPVFHRPRSGCRQPFGECLALVVAYVGADDPRALAHQDLRLRGPLAARGAGDHDRPPRKSVIHQASP